MPLIPILRETRKLASGICFRVTGDGHQGISHSGISHSAFGSRLQAPAAPPQLHLCTAIAHVPSSPRVLWHRPMSTCHRASVSPRALARAHLCTFAQELRSDLHLCTVSPLSLPASPLCFVPSCPPALVSSSDALWPPCHRASVSPRGLRPRSCQLANRSMGQLTFAHPPPATRK